MVQRKTNPRTQITEIQKAFEADLYHRLIDGGDSGTSLKHDIVEKVVDEDALGLTTISFAELARAQLDFEFAENPEKASDFEDWLDGRIADGVLERSDRGRIIDAEHFSGDYIRGSSKQGVKHADRELKRAGVDIADDASVDQILQIGVHDDILKSSYLRTYDELEGVTKDMATEISRVMSDSLAEGINPRETARRMNDRVDIGLTRSRRIARTETARTYNLHSAARYDDLGVTEVRILTANPCDRCVDLREGGSYPVSEAGSLLPEHPNCVCSIAPVTETIEV